MMKKKKKRKKEQKIKRKKERKKRHTYTRNHLEAAKGRENEDRYERKSL